MADSAGAAPVREIEVEVIYCVSRSTPDSSVLRLPEGACVEDALRAAGTLQRHPEIDAGNGQWVGIWGRSVSLQQSLSDGDRVEIYRPLLVDPKDARRLRQRSQAARRTA